MRYASTVFGFSVGVLLMLIGYVIWHRTWRNSLVKFGAFFASFIPCTGTCIFLLFCTELQEQEIALPMSFWQTSKLEIILRGIIPQGSVVYWDGGLSAAPLLYLPGVKIFPAQINSAYSFLSNGDTAELFRFGFWNEEMAAEWKATANFFIIEDKRYDSWKEYFNPQAI